MKSDSERFCASDKKLFRSYKRKEFIKILSAGFQEPVQTNVLLGYQKL